MGGNFLYSQIYDSLFQDIVSGTFKAGDLLPSEKQLCQTYNVSLITVRRALKALNDANIVDKIQGKGTVVTAAIRKTDSTLDKNIGVLVLYETNLAETKDLAVPFDKKIYNQNMWHSTIYNSIYKRLSDQYNIMLGYYDCETILNDFESTVFCNIQRIFILGGGNRNRKLIEFLQSKGKLVAVFNMFDKDVQVCSICSDEREKVFQLMDHLIRLGHKKIAAINGDITFSGNVERFMGIQEALMKNSIPIKMPFIKWGNKTAESGYYLTKEIFSQGEQPTAIFCANDNMAAGCLYAVQELGLNCPEDVSIVGYDNNPALHRSTSPMLTTIDPQFELLGEKVAEKLIRQVWFDDFTTVEGRIILRDSIAPPKNA